MKRDLYKKCNSCGGHSYLTMGGYYFCTMCKEKEYIMEELIKIRKRKNILEKRGRK